MFLSYRNGVYIMCHYVVSTCNNTIVIYIIRCPVIYLYTYVHYLVNLLLFYRDCFHNPYNCRCPIEHQMLQIISQDIHVSKTHRFTLENTEQSIKNGQHRAIGNTGLRHRREKKHKKKPNIIKKNGKIGNNTRH